MGVLPTPADHTFPAERVLKLFRYGHLAEELHELAKSFSELAAAMCTPPTNRLQNNHHPAAVGPGPERTIALRKLLEARDAAVLARMHPEFK